MSRDRWTFIIISTLVCAVCACLPLKLNAQNLQDPRDPRDPNRQVNPVKEYVEVINIEVIVRAQRSGQPAAGLPQSVFTLYENGEKQKITSFMGIRRKIGLTGKMTDAGGAPGPAEPLEPVESPPKRLFFIYTWISEPGSRCTEALDYFFEHIYREGDYALIIVKNQAFKITRLDEIAKILPQIKNKIEENARVTKTGSDQMLDKADALLRDFEIKFKNFERQPPGNEKMAAENKRVLVDRLKTDYRALWDEYKYKNVFLNTEKLKAIAATLKTVNLQKWGLVFYQRETFPQFNPESIFIERNESFDNLIELRTMFETLTREMKTPSLSLSQLTGVRQAFIDANATFHLLLFEKRSTGQPGRYITVDYIHSDWQTAFKNISEATGGEVIDSDKLQESLRQAVEKEDIYYRLTYAPKVTADNNVRKIEVKSAEKNLDLLYNRQATLQKANEITIDNFSFTYPTLEFTLGHYQQLFDGSQLYGDIEFTLTVIHPGGEKLSIKKTFEPSEEEITYALKLNFPHDGKYTLIIEALDRQTGKSALYSEEVKAAEVSETGFDDAVLITGAHEKDPGIDSYGKNKLKVLLDNAADYCEKLKNATYYFTCEEKIMESSFAQQKEIRSDTFVYQYQIIMEDDGKINEKRTLMENTAYQDDDPKIKEKTKIKEVRDLVITKFYSRYPFLMPVTLLARENRKNFRYRLLAEEQVGGRQTFKINVEPRQKDLGAINHGVVWVDATDGSVIKIELNPHAISGIETLRETAGRKGMKLKVTDTHWYELKKGGVRFPNRTEIHEAYLAPPGAGSVDPGPMAAFEETRTVFSYTNYRFFKVNVNVVDTQHN
ncbi:MAG: hypothetical protein NT166_06990 [Candidatus Aminicenantes bacterium]|nr:hypothetical protein [Candidatus Aminicenantes bacterium]